LFTTPNFNEITRFKLLLFTTPLTLLVVVNVADRPCFLTLQLNIHQLLHFKLN
jgi:hypothetical protein